MKITKDGFIWKIINSDEAKTIFSSGALSIYKLYDDDSEALIKEFEDIEECMNKGLDIGIEVGQITKEMYEKISL